MEAESNCIAERKNTDRVTISIFCIYFIVYGKSKFMKPNILYKILRLLLLTSGGWSI
jgi:hypothetical protein